MTDLSPAQMLTGLKCWYRPGKPALDAVGLARKRCRRYDWILDLDIKGFLGSVAGLLLRRSAALVLVVAVLVPPLSPDCPAMVISFNGSIF